MVNVVLVKNGMHVKYVMVLATLKELVTVMVTLLIVMVAAVELTNLMNVEFVTALVSTMITVFVIVLDIKKINAESAMVMVFLKDTVIVKVTDSIVRKSVVVQLV